MREIATLQHELTTLSWSITGPTKILEKKRTPKVGRRRVPNTYAGDDPMKRAFRIAKPVLSRRELAKVLRRSRHHVVEQAEHDSASRLRVDRHVELHFIFFKRKRYQRKICTMRSGCARTNMFALFFRGVCRQRCVLVRGHVEM